MNIYQIKNDYWGDKKHFLQDNWKISYLIRTIMVEWKFRRLSFYLKVEVPPLP